MELQNPKFNKQKIAALSNFNKYQTNTNIVGYKIYFVKFTYKVGI